MWESGAQERGGAALFDGLRIRRGLGRSDTARRGGNVANGDILKGMQHDRSYNNLERNTIWITHSGRMHWGRSLGHVKVMVHEEGSGFRHGRQETTGKTDVIASWEDREVFSDHVW